MSGKPGFEFMTDKCQEFSDWLVLGKKISHRNVDDPKRRHGEIIGVLPFGEFVVKWEGIKQPEATLRYDLQDC